MSEWKFGEPLEPMKSDPFIGFHGEHFDGGTSLNHIADRNGEPFAQVVNGNLREKRDRIIACLNACAGMDDPAAEIAAKDAEITALRAEVEDWRDGVKRVMEEDCPTDEVHCSCVPTLKREVTALRARLARADELLKSTLPMLDYPRVPMICEFERTAAEFRAYLAERDGHAER